MRHELIFSVNYRIVKQISENRFENADITFKNIRQIKEIFTQKLINIYHARIEYPEENEVK